MRALKYKAELFILSTGLGIAGTSFAQINVQADLNKTASSVVGNLEDLVNKQRKLYELKLENQIREESNRGRSSSNERRSVSSQELGVVPADEIRVAGIYGVAEDLIAQLEVRGSKISVRSGTEFVGWTVVKVDDRSVSLILSKNRSVSSSVNTRSKNNQNQTLTRIWLYRDKLPEPTSNEGAGYTSESNRPQMPPVPPGIVFPGNKPSISTPPVIPLPNRDSLSQSYSARYVSIS